MAEAIQFHCPACGITLQVPVAASGTQGPCPRCRQEIVCPDLTTGHGARRVSISPSLAVAAPEPRPSRDADPFNPFRGRFSPTPAPEPEAPAPEPEATAPEPEAPAPEPEATAPEPEATAPEPEATAPEPEAPAPEPEAPAPEPEATAPEPEAPAPEPEAAAPREPSPAPPAPPTPTLSPAWIMVLLLFFSALAGLAGFTAGYASGSRQVPSPAPTVFPPAAPVATPPAAPEVVPPAAPAPPVAPPPAEAPRPGEKPAEPEPLKIIAGPEAALKAFLAAPDWRARAKHVLHPERIAGKMEAYHADTPDGPTAALSLKVDASHDDPDKGTKLVTYRVATGAAPDGFPVAVQQTPDGWKVDWESFVEFRDDHFRRFAAGEGSDAGAFHLLVRNTHYFGVTFPGSDKLTAFRVDPPLPEREQYAFVSTGSELHKTLAAATEWGRPCAAVVQLARKKHDIGKAHLEITAILAPNWRPQE